MPILMETRKTYEFTLYQCLVNANLVYKKSISRYNVLCTIQKAEEQIAHKYNCTTEVYTAC